MQRNSNKQNQHWFSLRAKAIGEEKRRGENVSDIGAVWDPH